MKTRGYKMPASLLETTTDPRKRPGSLEATHLPACDGGPWPGIDPSDILSRQKLEFLAVYSHLNRLYDYMNVLRGSGSREEKQVVAALQRVIAFRDQLEDRYAPTGFCGAGAERPPHRKPGLSLCTKVCAGKPSSPRATRGLGQGPVAGKQDAKSACRRSRYFGKKDSC